MRLITDQSFLNFKNVLTVKGENMNLRIMMLVVVGLFAGSYVSVNEGAAVAVRGIIQFETDHVSYL
jgi:hypothetical protein